MVCGVGQETRKCCERKRGAVVTVYCDISECVFNKELPEPHQRSYGYNYTPIGTMGQYSGRCGLSTFKVESKTVHTSQTIHIIPECTNFSTSTDAFSSSNAATTFEKPSNDDVQIVCDEKRCLHYSYETQGCVSPIDWYVSWTTINNLGDVTKYAKCESFSNRGVKGHIDWSRSGKP